MKTVCNGKSIDTSMGFTPTAGVPMSTRSGDLAPGFTLVWGSLESKSMKIAIH